MINELICNYLTDYANEEKHSEKHRLFEKVRKKMCKILEQFKTARYKTLLFNALTQCFYDEDFEISAK